MKKLCIVILSLTAAASAFAQTKTVTNDDLEKFRQKRVESEKKLKERYAELGFPSPEQIEKQNAERRARMEQYSDELRRRRVESQNNIIAEANELRTQLAAVDAQINYLRGQGGTTSGSGFVYSYGYAPYGFRRSNRSVLPQLRNLPPNARTVQEYASMYPSSQGLYNQSIGNVRIGGSGGNIGGGISFGGRSGYGGNRYYRGGAIAPVIVGGSYNSNDVSQDLIFLEQQRAGLLARWNILAEEARRAGIRLD
jgi:hypothetical protein